MSKTDWQNFIKDKSINNLTKIIVILGFHNTRYNFYKDDIHLITGLSKESIDINNSRLLEKIKAYLSDNDNIGKEIMYYLRHQNIDNIIDELELSDKVNTEVLDNIKLDILKWSDKELTKEERLIFFLNYYFKGLTTKDISRIIKEDEMKIADNISIIKEKYQGFFFNKDNYDWNTFIRRSESKFLNKLSYLRESLTSGYKRKICTDDVLEDIYRHSLEVLSETLYHKGDIEFPLSFMYGIITNLFRNWIKKLPQWVEPLLPERENKLFGQGYPTKSDFNRDKVLSEFKLCLESSLKKTSKLIIYFRYYKRYFLPNDEQTITLLKINPEKYKQLKSSLKNKITNEIKSNKSLNKETMFYIWIPELENIWKNSKKTKHDINTYIPKSLY